MKKVVLATAIILGVCYFATLNRDPVNASNAPVTSEEVRSVIRLETAIHRDGAFPNIVPTAQTVVSPDDPMLSGKGNATEILRETCQRAVEQSTKYPSTLRFINGPEFPVLPSGNKKFMLYTRLDFEAKNDMGAMLPYAATCAINKKFKVRFFGVANR